MFFNNLVNQPTTTQQGRQCNVMITINTFEASWSKLLETGTFTYGHHTQTGNVSLGDALVEIVQMFYPILGVAVESIDGYDKHKIVITSSYGGVLHRALVKPADDGIMPRGIDGPNGYAIVFSYSGDDEASGIDGSYGFELFATTVWKYLRCNRELRSKKVQKMLDEHDAALGITAS